MVELSNPYGRLGSLLPSQKADASGECAPGEITEGKKLRRADVVVHEYWISVTGDVVETSTRRPISSQEMKALLQVRVQ